jgi:RNA polymerase sigma factor for flagellar operon FliA
MTLDATNDYGPSTQAEQADSAGLSRDALVIDNLPVVALVVGRMSQKLPPFVDREELRSAGILGLIDAAKRYDSSRGAKFRTYAELRVRGAIVDFLRSQTWAPRGLHRHARRMESARSAVEQRTGCAATVSEIAGELDISLEQYHRLLSQINALDIRADSGSAESGDQIADTSNPLEQLERKALIEIVYKAVEALPERQKMVLWLYYYEELTMKEVGAVLDINEARVSQLHSKAILTLRRELNDRICRGREKDSHRDKASRRATGRRSSAGNQRA